MNIDRNRIIVIATLVVLTALLYYFHNLNQQTASNRAAVVRQEMITKGKLFSDKYMESNPFVLNGKLYYLISDRNDEENKHSLVIYDHEKKEKISPHFGDQLSLASAFVEGDTLYIFGTKHWTEYGKSEIFEITTTDLQHFTEPRSVFKAREHMRFFNTSVTKDEARNVYVMALETDEKDKIPFTIRFLKSWTLDEWQLDEYSAYGKDTYVACPTIRYVGDSYYLLLGDEHFYDPNCPECKQYITRIAKSKDLITWETSAIPFLLPDPDGSEGLSAADVDLAEYEGLTYIHYSISDQSTWGDLKTATFNGSMKELFSLFFQ